MHNLNFCLIWTIFSNCYPKCQMDVPKPKMLNLQKNKERTISTQNALLFNYMPLHSIFEMLSKTSTRTCKMHVLN